MQNITNSLVKVRFIALTLAFAMATAATATITVIDGTAGSEADAFAMGRFLDSSNNTIASWSLNSTVSGTDFSNDAAQGGDSGLQYVMINEVLGSDDTNSVIFGITPINSNVDALLTISQSPYFDNPGTWNGGNFEAAQFTITWAGSQTATLTDPDNQIAGFGDGAEIASGSTVLFSDTRIFNSNDSWKLTLPSGVEEVQLDWASQAPVINSDLTREWVTFDVQLNAVPEPASGAMLSIALLYCLGIVRGRRS